MKTTVLTSIQKRVLTRLGPIAAGSGFYLAGGTAVALQLGHRRSIDFDWFSRKPLHQPLRLAQRLHNEGTSFEINQMAPDTLQGTVSRVRVSFFGYRYQLLQPKLALKQFQCDSASLADLAA